MNVNINKRGQSFKGVTAYLLHDKSANTSERLEWGVVENVYIQPSNNSYDDIQQASRLMAWTDKNRDFIKLENGGNLPKTEAEAGNVYHYSLAWAKTENPTREHMEETARDHIKKVGLSDHQYYMVSHSDTDHAHVHIVANLVHPETGNIHKPYKDFDISDEWANDYEKEHGIVSEKRAAKYEAWEQDKLAFEVKDKSEEYKKAATLAYHHSDGMASFRAALEEQGLTLASGRKSYVVVSAEGDPYNLAKMIDFQEEMKGRGAATKALNAKLEGLDKSTLPNAKELENERKHYDRDKQETEQQNALDIAAHEQAQEIAEAQNKADIKKAKDAANFSIGDMVKAHERGNIAVIESIKGNEKYGVVFTNKETGNEFKKDLLESEFTLFRKVNYGLDTEGMTEDEIKLLVKQHEYMLETKAFEMRERWGEYQRFIDNKILESREKWHIDELTNEQTLAAKDLAAKQGFWCEITKQKKDAQEALEAARLNLHEQLVRHEQDILVINEKRPEWLRKQEIEKHGFKHDEALQKIERDNVAASATTSNERGLFAHIKAKITEHAAKRENKKQSLAAELKVREEERESVVKQMRLVEAKARNEREQKQSEQKATKEQNSFDNARRLQMDEQFKDNANKQQTEPREAQKLQRDMSQIELDEYKERIRADNQQDTVETPAQEFEQAVKMQRDMSEDELTAEREKLREQMQTERERLELEQGDDNELERD